jgi:hypothetical protein
MIYEDAVSVIYECEINRISHNAHFSLQHLEKSASDFLRLSKFKLHLHAMLNKLLFRQKLHTIATIHQTSLT